MNDMLGYQICRKIEKTTLEKFDDAFTEDDFSKTFDNRNPIIFGIFMYYYAFQYFGMKDRGGILVERYNIGDRKFLLATSPEIDFYKNIDGIKCRFFGATVDKNDNVKVLFINDKDDSMIIEYHPLLSIKMKHSTNSLAYFFEKQNAYDYLITAFNDCLVKG